MAIEKYRVRDVARDFGMPAKVITEILDKYATAPKSNMQALEDHELSIVFEHLTQNNQISSIAAIYADEPKKPEPPKVQPAPAQKPAQTAKPAAQQPQQKPAQPVQQRPAQQPQQKSARQHSSKKPRRPRSSVPSSSLSRSLPSRRHSRPRPSSPSG